MKLEPVAVMDRDGDVYKSLPCPNWHPPHTNLYSEDQLRAEIEKRDAVLRVALEAFTELDKPLGQFDDQKWEDLHDKAIKAIQEVLG